MKTGVALQGGGGKGSYQIGAWRAFRDLNLEFHGVVGTSIGAINGAMMVQGDLALAESLWRNISPDKVVAWEKYAGAFNDLITGNHQLRARLPEAFKELLDNRGLDTSPLEEMLRTHIDEGRLRRSSCEYGLCSVQVAHYQPKMMFIDEIPPGELINYILASAGLLIFQKKKIDGATHIDGGYFDDFPISMLLGRDYQKIVAVSLHSRQLRKLPQQDGVEITLVAPDESLGSMLDFSSENVAWRIERGYTDTMHVLGNCRGRRYCINFSKTTTNTLAFLQEKIATNIKLLEKLGLDEGDSRRIYFEKLVPLVASALGLDAKASYEDILALAIEHAAHKAGLEKMRVWDFTEIYRKLQGTPNWSTHSSLPALASLPLLGEALAVTTNKEALLDIFASNLLEQSPSTPQV